MTINKYYNMIQMRKYENGESVVMNAEFISSETTYYKLLRDGSDCLKSCNISSEIDDDITKIVTTWEFDRINYRDFKGKYTEVTLLTEIREIITWGEEHI